MEPVQEQESVELETEDLNESKEPDYEKGESVRETVLKAIQENAKDSPDSGDQSVEPVTKPKKSEAVEGKETQDISEDDLDPDLSPPARLDARAKQVFNNLPKTLKRAFSKSIKDLEAGFTKGQQELTPLKQKYSRIDELLQPHRSEWAQVGLTDDQAVAELINTHEKLKNPKTKEHTFRWLAQNTGLTHLIKEPEEGQTSNEVDISSHPHVLALQNEISALHEKLAPVYDNYQQTFQAEQSREVQTAVDEVTAVKNERDSLGRYRYPKLHDEEFVARLRPLVVEAVRTAPTNIGYGVALRRVYEIFESPVGASAAQPNNSPPAVSNTQIHNRSSLAGVSVRGRSALPQGSSNGNIEVPPEARGSVRDTVAWVVKNRGRGI